MDRSEVSNLAYFGKVTSVIVKQICDEGSFYGVVKHLFNDLM